MIKMSVLVISFISLRKMYVHLPLGSKKNWLQDSIIKSPKKEVYTLERTHTNSSDTRILLIQLMLFFTHHHIHIVVIYFNLNNKLPKSHTDI